MLELGEMKVYVERVLYFEDHCSFDVCLEYEGRVVHTRWMCSNDEIEMKNDLLQWLQVAVSDKPPQPDSVSIDPVLRELLKEHWKQTRKDVLFLFGSEQALIEFLEENFNLCLE